MELGTAKPTPEEQQGVPHYLVNSLSIRQPYDVKQFETDALRTLQQLFSTRDMVVATGGSGLYIKTLCEGIDDMPDIDPEIRKQWDTILQKEGLEALALQLKKVDPAYYRVADIQNPRRVLRALEIYTATGVPFTEWRKNQANNSAIPRNFNVIKIGLSINREALYERINERVNSMVQQGLVEEARSLYPFRHLAALHTVGYQELFPYFEEAYDLAEAIRLIKRNTRRYAKRQMTWFRKDADIRWFDLTQQPPDVVLQEIIHFIDNQIQN